MILLLAAFVMGVATVLALSLVALRLPDTPARQGRSPPQIIPALPGAPAAPEAARFPVPPRHAALFIDHTLGGTRKFRRVLRLVPPYLPRDARTIEAGAHVVVIAGVETPEFAAVCEDEARGLWACGLEARAATYAIIRGEPLYCEDDLPAEGGRTAGEAMAANCLVRGQDLSVEMVRSGFARPAGPGPADAGGRGMMARSMAEAEAEARAARRGLWQSDWRIRG